MKLSPKQHRFVAEYLVDLNATQAAIRAGYSKKTAAAQGSRLLTKVEIRALVDVKTTKQLQTADLSAVRVLEEYRRLAFCDVRDFFDAEGNLKPFKDLTAEQAAALASFEVIVKNAKAGDGHTDTIHKLRLWDKTKALEGLGKHFGLFKETIDVQGGLELAWADE